MAENQLLDAVQKKLHKLHVKFISVGISDKPGKKLRITLLDGSTVNFGQSGSSTYLEGASEQKQKAYRARASKIKLKDGSRAIDCVGSPAWLSWHILW